MDCCHLFATVSKICYIINIIINCQIHKIGTKNYENNKHDCVNPDHCRRTQLGSYRLVQL